MDKAKKLVSQRAVVVFSISSCCMCHTVKSLLQDLGVNAAVHELDEEPRGREMEKAPAVLVRCNPLVPLVFIGGKLVGSTDRIMSLHLGGKLVPLLHEAGALWGVVARLSPLHRARELWEMHRKINICKCIRNYDSEFPQTSCEQERSNRWNGGAAENMRSQSLYATFTKRSQRRRRGGGTHAMSVRGIRDHQRGGPALFPSSHISLRLLPIPHPRRMKARSRKAHGTG
ncbi:Glutaredoxin [Musa troglodytarum]|uniref:Glutaredoxin n=1 Tax=Musa troglodytarum TaxID=320322 RepID=A0A9E7K5P5_9LILI|nr:Glutaredoxin [Musa troglodytarum]